MKRTINKSPSVLPLKMQKVTNAKSSLSLGLPKLNKHIIFNSADEAYTLTSNGNMELLPADRMMPESAANATSSEEESDEEAAPAVCSLKTSKDKTQTAVLLAEKEIKLLKLKEMQAKKDLRAKQHQRNLKQKLDKSERAKKLEALMLDKSMVKDTATLLEAQRRAESSEDGYGSNGEDEDLATTTFEGKRTVFEDDNLDELEDIFRPEIAAPKSGVHVVSLETTEDYKVQKAIEFKNRMFFGSSVKRMSNGSFKSVEDKRKVKKSVQLARNLRLVNQRL